jgi:hypothetical protein
MDHGCCCGKDEGMRRRHGTISPESQEENKAAAELRAELIASCIALPPHPGIRNLQPLVEECDIRTTKAAPADKRAHQDKTIDDLKKASVVTGFIFGHNNCPLPELQELGSLHNITSSVAHPRNLEGWCGRPPPKGLLQILCERGIVDPAVPV